MPLRQREEDPDAPADGPETKRNRPNVTRMLVIRVTESGPSAAEMAKCMGKEELKNACAEQKLDIKGKKADLAHRLVENRPWLRVHVNNNVPMSDLVAQILHTWKYDCSHLFCATKAPSAAEVAQAKAKAEHKRELTRRYRLGDRSVADEIRELMWSELADGSDGEDAASGRWEGAAFDMDDDSYPGDTGHLPISHGALRTGDVVNLAYDRFSSHRLDATLEVEATKKPTDELGDTGIAIVAKGSSKPRTQYTEW